MSLRLTPGLVAPRTAPPPPPQSPPKLYQGLSTPTATPPLPPLETALNTLVTAAKTLNIASDQLSQQVSEVDSFLKPLNIGLPCWVIFGGPWRSQDGYSESSEEIGYSKINGKWGISIRTMNQHFASGDDRCEEWPFNEAPRQLRLQAVEHIPALLIKLSEAVAKFTQEMEEKTASVRPILAALKGGSKK